MNANTFTTLDVMEMLNGLLSVKGFAADEWAQKYKSLDDARSKHAFEMGVQWMYQAILKEMTKEKISQPA